VLLAPPESAALVRNYLPRGEFAGLYSDFAAYLALLVNLATRWAVSWVAGVKTVTIVCRGQLLPRRYLRFRLQNRVVVSVRPQSWPEVPEATARVTKAAFPKGALPLQQKDGKEAISVRFIAPTSGSRHAVPH
jgi:hypothetical protein